MQIKIVSTNGHTENFDIKYCSSITLLLKDEELKKIKETKTTVIKFKNKAN